MLASAARPLHPTARTAHAQLRAGTARVPTRPATEPALSPGPWVTHRLPRSVPCGQLLPSKGGTAEERTAGPPWSCREPQGRQAGVAQWLARRSHIFSDRYDPMGYPKVEGSKPSARSSRSSVEEHPFSNSHCYPTGWPAAELSPPRAAAVLGGGY